MRYGQHGARTCPDCRSTRGGNVKVLVISGACGDGFKNDILVDGVLVAERLRQRRRALGIEGAQPGATLRQRGVRQNVEMDVDIQETVGTSRHMLNGLCYGAGRFEPHSPRPILEINYRWFVINFVYTRSTPKTGHTLRHPFGHHGGKPRSRHKSRGHARIPTTTAKPTLNLIARQHRETRNPRHCQAQRCCRVRGRKSSFASPIARWWHQLM